MGHWRSANNTGENNPVWKDDVEVECKQCGDTYSVIPARAEKTSFCSPECRWDWLSENKSGQDSPHWRPGANLREEIRRLLPGPSWRQIREEHTSEQCRLCGAEEQLQLHHIVPILAGGTHHPDNLLTLCVGCHNRADGFIRRYVDFILVPKED
jgi:5-methylcytosine-specific restriction endonuclease McrA